MGDGYVDLKLLSADAVYRDGDGGEHVVDWVTQQDLDLARRISEIAADQGVGAVGPERRHGLLATATYSPC